MDIKINNRKCFQFPHMDVKLYKTVNYYTKISGGGGTEFWGGL